jgi:sigma-E factor negative regulatory protein RseC
MTENGVVNKVEKNFAWVTMVKGEQCAGCTACKAFGDGSFEIVALNEQGAKPGDIVEVEVNPKQVIKYSTIVFLLPVLSLIIGYFLGSSYLTQIGLSSEAAGIIGSMGLMIITFMGIIGYDRIVGKSQQINAHITRIFKQETIFNAV